MAIYYRKFENEVDYLCKVMTRVLFSQRNEEANSIGSTNGQTGGGGWYGMGGWLQPSLRFEMENLIDGECYIHLLNIFILVTL